jgi:hypothetical protein
MSGTGSAMMAMLRRGTPVLFLLGAALLLSACGSMSASDPRGQVLVVDAVGAPLADAVVLPDAEYDSASPRYTDSDLKERSTNAKGTVLVFLDDYYWASDSCYHFRVHKAGYEDETMAVSKDLFPAVLKIDMRPRVPAANPSTVTRPR